MWDGRCWVSGPRRQYVPTDVRPPAGFGKWEGSLITMECGLMQWSSGAGTGKICVGSIWSPFTISLSLCCCYYDHRITVASFHTLFLQTTCRRNLQPSFRCSPQCWFCWWILHSFNSIFFLFLFCVLFSLLTRMEEVHEMAKRNWVPLSLLLHVYYNFCCCWPSYGVFL